MILRKLHTVDSTNSFLKDWHKRESLENLTTVVAEEQTKGRGQHGNTWLSENGKNLTFSTLLKIKGLSVTHQFELNQAVSLAILKVLNDLKPSTSTTKFEVKWPNDIMADGKKIAGILIENSLSKGKIKHSIIGIGLNVNQIAFPKNLNNVTSLQLLFQKSFDLDKLLNSILKSLHFYSKKIGENQSLQDEYLAHLYRFNIEKKYKGQNNAIFTGKIIDVKNNGQLEVLLQDKTTRLFNFKEISFI